MLTRFFSRYREYRRVGLSRAASARLAWMVAWARAVPAGNRDTAR